MGQDAARRRVMRDRKVRGLAREGASKGTEMMRDARDERHGDSGGACGQGTQLREKDGKVLRQAVGSQGAQDEGECAF